MESDEQRRHDRASGPMFCAIPAFGAGDGITGVPIASGPVGGVLLSVVLAVLVLATWWLMRRWSGRPGPATAASTPAQEANVNVSTVDVPEETPDGRIQEREFARL